MTASDASQGGSSGLDRLSASAAVAEALRHEILRGTIQGGEHLRQDAIATRFKVSQTITREAFKELSAQGFLRAEPRRGVRVSTLDPDEVVEITRLRVMLEVQALEWALPHMGENVLRSASKILDEIDAAGTTGAVISLNTRFHETLYSPAPRERTLALIGNLRLSFERYLRFTWTETPHLGRSQSEHRDLLSLCRTGQAKEACALLGEHINATGQLLIGRLKQT